MVPASAELRHGHTSVFLATLRQQLLK
ncbi:hypothetical protein E2C01_087154 [Portunus trituberculatus]|uniref:Uncharacterized protein n=1 Tax=Portunus trituberculatus TaxID=210409 RepID=A0A5B7J7D7_PORTR|nr:hypothetical protein [Portunus trituberculatus]